MVNIYLMKIRVTYELLPVWPWVKSFGRKTAGPKKPRLMSDYKLLIHATNTIAGIVYEIELARMPISLQPISLVPVEKKFSETRRYASVHQRVVELVKTIEDVEAMHFIDVQDQVNNRRHAYRETISPCACLTGIGLNRSITREVLEWIGENWDALD
jgi:hypothetical protein